MISTTITRNKKPAQNTYQMAYPEQLVQNEPTVEAEVELGDEDTIPSEPAPVEDQESVVPTELETTNSSEPENVEPEQEQSSETENVESDPEQEPSFEPEMQPEQEEQPQEEQLEVTPKKKASSKKK